MPEHEPIHKTTEIDGWLMLLHAWKEQMEDYLPSEGEEYNACANLLREAQDAILYQRPLDLTNVKGLTLTPAELESKEDKEAHGNRKVVWDDNT